jgi:hypothetical protein
MFVVCEHEEYDGKTRARVVDMMEQDGWDPADIVKPEAKDDGIPF